MDDMNNLIEECRKNIGPIPRILTPRERCDYFAMSVPPWLLDCRNDGIWQIYRAKDTLLTLGTVVWGRLVQANSLLFSPGKDDCPAMAIYGTDPSFDNDLPALEEVAEALFALKGTKPNDPELARFAKVITNERDRSMRVEIPNSLTGGRIIYSTTIMVYRKQLPNGVLSLPYFPLLVSPEDTSCTLMLPFQYWPHALRDRWASEDYTSTAPEANDDEA